MKRLILILAMMLGCGSTTETEQTTTTSAGGTGGTTSTTTTTETSGAATGGSAGTGGVPCDIPGQAPCEGQVTDAYPDPFSSYNDSQPFGGYLNPYPGTDEVGNGAGAARLGPWVTPQSFSGFSVVLGPVLPDPLQFAVWAEFQCGLPNDTPSMHASFATLADIQQETLPSGSVRATVAVPFDVEPGNSVYLAVVTTKFSTSFQVVQPTYDTAPRAMWFGIVDNNCDGETDPQLGWAYLDEPTDPSVSPYHYDLAFTLLQ